LESHINLHIGVTELSPHIFLLCTFTQQSVQKGNQTMHIHPYRLLVWIVLVTGLVANVLNILIDISFKMLH
jgi:hypothetical protein